MGRGAILIGEFDTPPQHPLPKSGSLNNNFRSLTALISLGSGGWWGSDGDGEHGARVLLLL